MNNIIDADTPGNPITGVILAGGRATRMGGQDKGLIKIRGKPMVLHIRDRLRPQVDSLLINANRNLEIYQALTACPVITDEISDYAGPLAGMAAALNCTTSPYLVAVPCDSPLLAGDLVSRLHCELVRQQAEIAMAVADGYRQPVFVMLSSRLRDSLHEFLAAGGRKIIHWYEQHRVVAVDFSDRSAMFENINTPEEQQRIEQQLRQVI